MRWVLPLAAAWLSLAGAVRADVVSPRPEAVAVTIYRDRPVRTADIMARGQDDEEGLALITETRTVDLPAGSARLRFEGVADGIMPQSAAVEGLPGALVERNFDYDLLSPGALVAHMIDQPVRIVRTDRKTGQAVSQDAVLRSGPDGVVLQTADRVEALRCSGGPERLVFDHVPADLADQPTLSALVDTPRAGRYVLKLSYLSVRLDWSADYVARVDPRSDRLDLTGWITLSNRSRISFADAPTAVVAGRLARENVDLPQIQVPSLNLNCWPKGTTHAGAPSPVPAPPPPPPPAPIMFRAMAAPVGEISVTAQKRVEQGELGDYKLYSLVEPTTIAANQTKQIQFLHQPAVRFERLYRFQAGFSSDPEHAAPTTLVLKLTNTDSQGLGLPLPAGSISLRQSEADAPERQLFVGAVRLRDTPIGQPVELTVGPSDAVTARQVIEKYQKVAPGRDSQTVTVTAFNASSAPAQVEILPDREDHLKIVSETRRHGLNSGRLGWTLPIAAGSSASLTYRVEFDRVL
jgi:hypothetical protein